MFRNVASKYDLMNDAMSLGIHRRWKDRLIERLDPQPDTRLLDVAGGTGDIAFRFLKQISKRNGDISKCDASVTILDINPQMLDAGRERATHWLTAPERKTDSYGHGHAAATLVYVCVGEKVEWAEGNAEQLSRVPDGHFDAYTIAFGIRNCTNIDRVLEEAHRVIRPGGVFYCLEFGKVDHPLLRTAYDVYSFNVIPLVGSLLSGHRSAYQYLVESIRKFPSQQDFAHMMQAAGFKHVTFENLTGGISAIHSGIKL